MQVENRVPAARRGRSVLPGEDVALPAREKPGKARRVAGDGGGDAGRTWALRLSLLPTPAARSGLETAG